MSEAIRSGGCSPAFCQITKIRNEGVTQEQAGKSPPLEQHGLRWKQASLILLCVNSKVLWLSIEYALCSMKRNTAACSLTVAGALSSKKVVGSSWFSRWPTSERRLHVWIRTVTSPYFIIISCSCGAGETVATVAFKHWWTEGELWAVSSSERRDECSLLVSADQSWKMFHLPPVWFRSSSQPTSSGIHCCESAGKMWKTEEHVKKCCVCVYSK